MPSNIAVAVTADVVDLQTKSLIANAELKGIGAQARALAADFVVASNAAKAEMLPQLQALAAQSAAAAAAAAKLRAEMAAMRSESAGLGGTLKDINERFESFVGFGRLFVAGAIAEEIKHVAEEVIGLAERYAEFGHQLEVASEQTGLSTLQLSGLKLAADENGVAFDTVTRLLTKFASSMQDSLQNPTDKAARALNALGISQDYVRQHSNDLAGMLQLVAQRLDQFAEGGNKAAIEAAIFGQRAGPQLTPILVQLANEGFGGLTARAQEAGVALDEDAAKKAAEAARTFKDFHIAVTGLENSLGSGLLPSLSAAARGLTTIIEKIEQFPDAVEHAMGPIGRLAVGVAKLMPGAAFPEVSIPFGGLTSLGTPETGHGASGSWEGPAKPQAPNIGNYQPPDTSGKDMREYQRQLDEELQAHLALISQASQVDGAYYARLEADARLAAAQKKITNDEELQQLITLENEKFGLLQKGLDEKISLYAASEQEAENLNEKDRVAYEQLLAQKKILTEQHYAAIDALKEQSIRQQTKLDKDEAKSWQGTVNVIEGAESQLVSSVLSGRQSLAQSVLQIAARMVEQEIAADLRAVTTRLLLKSTEATQEKALQQGGLLYHLFVETTKTDATVASTTARAAAETVAAGESKAANAAASGPVIMQDAAKAAAGAYSAIVGIPYVGPILAPIAAGVAYAAVAGYEALVGSFDVGTPYVPRTGLAMVHQGEAIFPAASNPFTSGVGGGNVTFAISALDGASVMRVLNNNRSTLMSVIRTAVRNGTPLPPGLR